MPIHNRKYLKSIRKELRSSLTPSEARLWKALKNSQIDGRKFRRQHSIGDYVVDFYCPSEKLVIEVDGAHHFTPSGEAADTIRDKYLAELNIKVMRFENDAIQYQMEMVIEEIRNAFGKG